MGCFFNKKPPPEIAFILRVLDETSVMNLAQLYAEARDKFQSQELMAKVNDRIKAVLKESGPSSTENQMTQPIDRDTAIALAKEANGLNVAIAASGVFMFSGNDLVRFYGLSVAHSRKDAEPVAWINSSTLKTFCIDRDRYPLGGGGDLSTARYMRSDHHNTALFTHPPEADKLLRQALTELMYQTENTIPVSGTELAIAAIRTYLEGKK